MTQTEFVSKAYEILSKGLIEIDGKFYYEVDSVIEAMEWMKDNMTKLIEVDTEKILENVFKKFV